MKVSELMRGLAQGTIPKTTTDFRHFGHCISGISLPVDAGSIKMHAVCSLEIPRQLPTLVLQSPGDPTVCIKPWFDCTSALSNLAGDKTYASINWNWFESQTICAVVRPLGDTYGSDQKWVVVNSKNVFDGI